MGFSVAARNLAADAIGAVAVRASLHTAEPGETGADEVVGAGYGRQTAAWDPAVGGLAVPEDGVAFDVPAGVTVTHAGFWTVAGVWLGGEAVTPTAFAAAGIYTLHPASTLSVV